MDGMTKPFTDEEKSGLLKKIQSDLPPGWFVHFSKTHLNRVFFFNKNDGRRTWEHPGSASGSRTQTHPGERKRKYDGKKKSSLNPNSAIEPKVQAVGAAANKISHPKSQFGDVISPQTAPPKKAFFSTANAESSKNMKRKRKKKKKNAGAGSEEKPMPCTVSSSQNIVKSTTSCTKVGKTAKTAGSSRNPDVNISKEVLLPPAIEDVEMTELDATPPKKQRLIHQKTPDSTVTDCENATSECYAFIIDTNILLRQCALDFIGKVMDVYETEKLTKNLTFITPWVVLQELDHLKKGKPQARSAISFLNEKFQANHTIIRGQSIFEAAAVIDGFTIENNDDRILQCCFTMQQSTDGSIPVLITRDKNLANKSLANGIKCFEDITDIQKLISGIQSRLNSRKIAAPFKTCDRLKPNIRVKLDVNKNVIPTIVPPPVSLKMQRSIGKDELSSMYSKACDLILPTLSFILEKEMKDAFGELWLDIVLRKPPWKMIDVLQCIQKHWLAVFKVLGVDRIIEVHASQMLSMEKNKVPSNVNFVKTWVFSAVCLIAGINHKAKYKEPVRSNLEELQKVHRSLMSTGQSQENLSASTSNSIMREVQEPSSQGSTQDYNNVEMALEVAKTDDFWIALDKIWTSIISHCCMVFQSLSFMPSKISCSPEICEALTATYSTVPPKPIAVHALPFIKDLIESLQASLEKFATTSISSPNQNFEPVFMDLLQTLWTTIQAFCVDCDVCCLINSHREICLSIRSSEEMIDRLKIGHHQLAVVAELLSECLEVVLVADN